MLGIETIKMKLCVCHATIWILMLVFAVVPGNCAKKNKIKIIVPHKINYVHYHHQPSPHSRISEPFYMDHLQNENEDESEEYENASDDIYDMHEDLEEPRKDFTYYTMLKTRFSHAPAVKPVYTYNGSFNKFRYPTTHAVVRYSDYPERKRRNSERRPSIYFDYK